MRIDVYIHSVTPDSDLSTLVGKVTTMSQQLEALTAEVARNTAVDESAIALIQGLATRIEQLKADPVALQALADELRQKNDRLAEAVTANTPAA
jgi:hypothetical protein